MGVPRTLAKGLSKLKEAAQARKAADVAGAMPYAGATAAALAGVTGSQEAEAGPLQTLGRAAPYLTSAALGGAAALQSQDAEAGKLKAGKEVIEALVRRAGDAGVSTGYRGGHTAPVSPEYHAPLHDMAKTYPDDIYSKDAPRFYGDGDPVMDRGSFDVINRVRGDENAPVIMYRAVPGYAPNEINPGDWVTPNLEYARQHGQAWDDYKILKGETNAGRLRTDGNSPHEFGYTGNATPALLGATAVGTGAGMYAASDAEAGGMPEYEQRLSQIPYPNIDNGDGSRSTHEMAVEVDDNGNWFAFPTIQPGDNGQLQRFELRDAQQRAMATGNYKAFGQDKDAALRYGEGGYKVGTNIEPPPQPVDMRQYMQDALEARTAADKFAQMRGSKAGYWEARRQELLDMVNGLGEMANNVVLPALDKPLQGYLGLAGTLGTLASGGGFEQAIQAGARNATQPIDQTTYGYGGAVTDALSPYTTPEAAAAAGALVHGGIQIASPF